ncbi:MAG: hypothetical protein J6M90_01570 [Oscillospiraceae bacterium]|nr:hypothetical protein [Oscillospiraceae bacterium]
MTKNRNQIYLIFAAIAVLFTVIAFAVPFNRNAVFFISYVFGLAAIALQIPFFKAAFDNRESIRSKVLGFPVFRVGYIYLGVQLVLSLLLMILSTAVPVFPVWAAVVLCAIVVCGAFICGMGADIARDAVERVEQTASVNTSAMMDMRSRSSVLASRVADADVKKALQSLADNFRFADPVSSEGTENADRNLDNALAALESAVTDRTDDIAELCANVQNALDERNTIAKMRKRG